MLDSSSPNLLRVSGVKRLLPAFEPSSSPPRFKRQKSRTALTEDENRYPTPVPSSSIGILPSSPPPVVAPVARRPVLKRTQSTVSERAPLSAVPSITLPENGEPILLGRSSNSSHYRLSANRLISRVHIKTTYIAGTGSAKPRIELKCIGWNGVKIHCQGRAWDLQKGDVFVSETEHAEIMLDVHDSRVVLAWPGSPALGNLLPGSPFPGPPTGRVARSPSLDWEAGNDENLDPWESARRVNARTKLTPISPTPRRLNGNSMIRRPSASMAETFLDIYEDEPVPEIFDETQIELPEHIADAASEPSRIITKDVAEALTEMVPKDDTLSFEGEIELPPMSLFSTAEALGAVPDTPPSSFCRPRASTSPLSQQSKGARRRSASISPNKQITLQNHLTNQLAFSRVNSMPLSELFANLPTALAASVTKERIKEILSEVLCIGEIKRVGKDAAGKPLEHQYYYIMDQDKDEGRRLAAGGRAGMRNCRKTHKVRINRILGSSRWLTKLLAILLEET